MKRILNNFITAIIKSQCNNGYRLNSNNKTNIVSTHVTPQWDKFEATIESWHIQRNPPTVHHVLYHVVCSHREPRLGRQWQRNGHEKGGERYTGNMRIAYCSGLFFISKKVGKETHASVFFFFFFCLDLGIGPQNDAHVSGSRLPFASSTTLFANYLFLTSTERHLNDTWKLHSTVILIFFSIKIRGGELWDRRGRKNGKKEKKREKNTRVSILTHRINSFYESSVMANDWRPKNTLGKSLIPLASRTIQCRKEST